MRAAKACVASSTGPECSPHDQNGLLGRDADRSEPRDPLIVFVDRRRRDDRLLEWKIRLFSVAAVLALVGLYLDDRWVTGAAIVVLAAAMLLRFLPGGGPAAMGGSENDAGGGREGGVGGGGPEARDPDGGGPDEHDPGEGGPNEHLRD